MQIPRGQLDFSPNSLDALQQYLECIRPHAANLDPQAMQNTLLASGCYLGEVLRLNAGGAPWPGKRLPAVPQPLSRN